MTIKKEIIWFAGAAILVSAFLYFSSPNIPDLDSLYYMRSAWLHRANSLLDTQFPWTYYSSIRLLGSDLWYGISLILMPLTYINDLALGIKLAGIFFTSLFLLGYFWVAERHQLAMKFLWPFLALFIVPNVLFQLTMMRPQTLSALFSIVLFSLLAKGNWLSVFLISLLFTFLHLNFFWMEIMIGGVFILLYFYWRFARRLFLKNEIITADDSLDWKKAFSIIAGGVAGWLLRPHPISAAKLLYVQVIKLLLEKRGNLPLLFGKEWLPYGWQGTFEASILFLIIWLAAIGFFIRFQHKNPKVLLRYPFEKFFLLFGSFIVSSIFFFLTIFVARKSIVFGVAFGILFSGLIYSYYLARSKFSGMIGAILLIIFLIAVPSALYQYGLSMNQTAFPPDAFRNAALWLKNNSNPGDIVFNTHWSNFSPLFFWNQKNYYIGGLDPIFQYDYSPTLYWEFHFISKDEARKFTCRDLSCSLAGRIDIYSALANDFNARYVLVRKSSNPNFYDYLENDSRFKKQFEDGKVSVFEILKK